MLTYLTGHDERLSKLEHNLSIMRSTVGTAQTINSEIGVEQEGLALWLID